MYEIEDGHQIPLTRSRYPFAAMSVGQSFLADHLKVHSAAYAFSRTHHGVKFTIRKQADGYRVWRIE